MSMLTGPRTKACQLGHGFLDRFVRLRHSVREWRESRTFWKWLDLTSLLCSTVGAFLRIVEFNVPRDEEGEERLFASGLGLCGLSKFCSDQVVTTALLLNWYVPGAGGHARARGRARVQACVQEEGRVYMRYTCARLFCVCLCLWLCVYMRSVMRACASTHTCVCAHVRVSVHMLEGVDCLSSYRSRLYSYGQHIHGRRCRLFELLSISPPVGPLIQICLQAQAAEKE